MLKRNRVGHALSFGARQGLMKGLTFYKKSNVMKFMLSQSKYETVLKGVKRVPFMLVLVIGSLSVTQGSDFKGAPSEPAKEAISRQAMVEKRRRELEDFMELFQSNAKPDEKRSALDIFRAKLQAEKVSSIPEQTAEEKAIPRPRIKESMRRFPEERRKVMVEYLTIVEAIEKLRSEEKWMDPDGRKSRLQTLMGQRHKMMEAQMAAMKAEVAKDSKKNPSASLSLFRQSIEIENKKLDIALAGSDLDARRNAIENFREAIGKAREARRHEIMLRLGGVVQPASRPPQSSLQ